MLFFRPWRLGWLVSFGSLAYDMAVSCEPDTTSDGMEPPMFRLSFLLAISLLSTPTVLHAANPWPDEYCFNGRWDLRTAMRAVTVNSGSYVLACFSGTGLDASFDVSNNQPSPVLKGEGQSSLPTLAWRIDERPWQEGEMAATVKLAEGLNPGPHRVMLMVRGLAPGGRLERPLPQWLKPALRIEFLGDSITEGVVVQEGRAGVVPGMPYTWPWLADARSSYAGQTALRLGAAWRQVGFGASGLVRAGNGGVPGALDSFNSFYAGCPRDAWQPDVVVVNQGTNEEAMAAKEYQALYGRYLALLRAAYPQAKIVALRPFCGAQAASIKAAVEECHRVGDVNVFYIDTTGWYQGPIHPNADASAVLADKLAQAIRDEVLTAKTPR
jgi:lysophospholipase L1-like esterase